MISNITSGLELYLVPATRKKNPQIVYGKKISRTSCVYYDRELNSVILSGILQEIIHTKITEYKYPKYLENIPTLGKETSLKKVGEKNTRYTSISTDLTETGPQITITIEKRKGKSKINLEEIVLNIKNSAIDYNLLKGEIIK